MPDSLERRLCSLLIQYRLDRGLTQVDLAKRLRMRQQRVSRIELGTARLTVKDLVAFAAALEIDPAELLRAATTQTPTESPTADEAADAIPSR